MFWRKKSNGKFNPNQIARDYNAVAVTDTGNSRAHNEDAVRFIRPADQKTRQNMGFLAIVADGMGGHASGELASSIAIETISEVYYNSHRKPLKALQLAGEKANEEIWQLASQDKKLRGMGTTCTAAAIIHDHIYILHIGDSRAYLYKKGRAIQLSEDHTYVQQLLNSGEITPFEARNHPDGNILTKSLGTAKKRSCDVFLSEHRFEEGDKLLLCSDGLYEYFSTQELAGFLAGDDLGNISQKLSASVLDRGAHDNFTILLVEARKEVRDNNLPTRAITVEL
ncbi:MAG: Stp1/IreP family PP2C-type Ser/Thr phosphatase [Balneolaceae bacterium]|nr:MAG: Stp1/IreP family PP2C-type Ser/Thr phosphatase [Balneolaceae bacterium]